MKSFNLFVHNLLKKFGYDIVPYKPVDPNKVEATPFGINPYHDISVFLAQNRSPLVIDAGANIGQTVDQFKATFPSSVMHSFEPSPTTFEKLEAHCNTYSAVTAWNKALGSNNAVLPFLENTSSDMSSFFRPGETGWGKVEKETNVEVIMLDSFAKQENIEFIDVLKSDTQGFDFEVLKGASQLMRENKIGIILYEALYSTMYEGTPVFTEVFNYLLNNKFLLVGVYWQYHKEHHLSWSDVLFIHTDYKKSLGF